MDLIMLALEKIQRQEVGRDIRRWRRDLKLSQRKVACDLKVGIKRLRDLEQGKYDNELRPLQQAVYYYLMFHQKELSYQELIRKYGREII